MLSKEKVIEALKPVNDPELMLSIVDLGLIYDVRVEEITSEGQANERKEGDKKNANGKYKVTIDMTLTSPACPYGPMLIEWTKYAAEKIEDVKSAEIKIVWDPPWDPRTMATEECKLQLGLL